MPTNTRESGLETLIVDHLTEQNNYEQGESADYNREYAVNEPRPFLFLEISYKKNRLNAALKRYIC